MDCGDRIGDRGLAMRRLDDPNWRYINAAKSHVGFKQRMRRYAEMVRNEQTVGLTRGSDGSVLVASDAAVGPRVLSGRVD